MNRESPVKEPLLSSKDQLIPKSLGSLGGCRQDIKAYSISVYGAKVLNAIHIGITRSNSISQFKSCSKKFLAVLCLLKFDRNIFKCVYCLLLFANYFSLQFVLFVFVMFTTIKTPMELLLSSFCTMQLPTCKIFVKTDLYIM